METRDTGIQRFPYAQNVRYVCVYQSKKDRFKISYPISFINHLINSNFVHYLDKFKGIFKGIQQQFDLGFRL